MTNSWIEHIKEYAKNNNLSYACALSTPECKNTYSKTSSKSKKKPECKTNCKSCETCKINKEPHKMYDKPIGPIKPKKSKPKYVLEYDKRIGRTIHIVDNGGKRDEMRKLMKIFMNSSKKDMKVLKWYDENVYNSTKSEPIQSTKELEEYSALLNSGKFRKKKPPLL
jgi:hypothetical protein